MTMISGWREGESQVAVQLETIARELDVQTEDLLQRSMLAFFAHEIRLVEWDIADLKERYQVASPAELEDKIKSRQIYSHPAWEDLIEWETLESYISRLRALQGKVEWEC